MSAAINAARERQLGGMSDPMMPRDRPATDAAASGGNPLNIESHPAPDDGALVVIEGSQLNNGRKTVVRVSILERGEP
jgi:hypothetical protein